MPDERLYRLQSFNRIKIKSEVEKNEYLDVLGAYYIARTSIEKIVKSYKLSVKTLEKSIKDLSNKEEENKLGKTNAERLSNDMLMLPEYKKKLNSASKEYDYRISNAFELISVSLYIPYMKCPEKYNEFKKEFTEILMNTFSNMKLYIDDPEPITYFIFYSGYNVDRWSFIRKPISFNTFRKLLLDIISQRLIDLNVINRKKYQYTLGQETYLKKINKATELTFKDFVVRSNTFHCIHNDHDTESITAVVKVMSNMSQIMKQEIPAGYCKECGIYFILESTYEKLLEQGVPLCRTIDVKTYRKNEQLGTLSLAKESILKQCGYNVSEKDDLTVQQRQKILIALIDNNILSEMDIISYLDFFINQHKSKENYKQAVNKWKADREYIIDYQAKEKAERTVGISSIKR